MLCTYNKTEARWAFMAQPLAISRLTLHLFSIHGLLILIKHSINLSRNIQL